MKVILDIEDSKSFSLLEVLRSLPYVKTQELTPYKADVLANIRESVEEMILIRDGKLITKDVSELINEL